MLLHGSRIASRAIGLLVIVATSSLADSAARFELSMPAVGAREHFADLTYEQVEFTGKVYQLAKPGSWLSVAVDVELEPPATVTNVWAREPELHRVQGNRLVPAADPFLSPSTIRRFREAAERGVRQWQLDRLGAPAQVRLVWRIGPGGTVDLTTFGAELYRDGDVLLHFDDRPTVVFLRGPSRAYTASFQREPDGLTSERARGLPAPVDGRCGLRPIVPDGIRRVELRDAILPKGQDIHPEYPDEPRRYRVGGSVLLDVLVDANGVVEGAVALRSVPGFPEFVQASLENVCNLRYLPQTSDGVPVPFVVERDFTFAIRTPTREQLAELPPPDAPAR